MSDTMNIKNLIDSGYIVVLDTNVLLELYRYSPDYADFALDCLEQIKGSIYLPYTVYMEFNRHHMSLYKKRQKSIDTSIKDSLTLVDNQMKKAISCCEELKKRNFPDTDSLIEDIKGKYESIKESMSGYFDDHSLLSVIKDNWTSDLPNNLVLDIYRHNQVMEPFDQEKLYQICDEGETRYKKEVPPGFKDAKSKDGIRKYSDLIIWKEIIRFAQQKRKNIIFITNDLKPDWWDQDKGGIVFKPALFDEFKRDTKVKDRTELAEKLKSEGQSLGSMMIEPYTSNKFFNEVSQAYHLHTPDAIREAVNLTAEAYIESIQEEAFDFVINDIIFSGTDFLDDSMTWIGSEGIEEWEIDSVTYDSFSVEECSDSYVVYEITYDVSMCGSSYDYWGRDDDTKEAILSYPYDHEVAGSVVVRVIRDVDFMIDFESDNEFVTAELEAALFSEVSFTDENE